MPEHDGIDTQQERLTRLWWSVPAASVLLLLTLAMLVGGKQDPTGRGTSYDAGSSGFRAVYLLLEDLGYPVERSKQPTGEGVRWVLDPAAKDAELPALADWVRNGGTLLLATSSADVARGLGLDVEIKKRDADPKDEDAEGPDLTKLSGGSPLVLGPREKGRVWVKAGGAPFVTIYDVGRGEVWLVNRPAFLTNALLPKADNAVLACRLAEAMRGDRIAFDEYVHGLRDRPSVAVLLLRPPALWMTLQLLLLTAILLWHHAPRFGSLQSVPPPRRRSVEEFLDALAALLERRGDYNNAIRTARENLARDIEQSLGLAADTPPEILARGRPAPADRRSDLFALADDHGRATRRWPSRLCETHERTGSRTP